MSLQYIRFIYYLIRHSPLFITPFISHIHNHHISISHLYSSLCLNPFFFFFFLKDPAPPDIYPLPPPDALPIYAGAAVDGDRQRTRLDGERRGDGRGQTQEREQSRARHRFPSTL